jgi:hypothetical protein
MDEMMLRLTTGSFGSGLDTTAILAFLGFAVMYLITPAVARTRDRPTGMALALYLLIGYAGISLLQLLLQWTQMDGMMHAGFQGRGQLGTLLFFGLAALKMLVFLIAMVVFVIGLQSIRVGQQDMQSFEDAVQKLQQLRDENADLRQRLQRERTP